MEEISVFYNARVLRGYELVHDELWVKGSKIIDPKSIPKNAVYNKINCKNNIISPGFIDLQVNGAFGVDFLTHPNLPRALEYVNKKMLSTGVTTYCPTLITSPPDYYHKTLPLIKPTKGSAQTGAGVLGVHCEGPFISKSKKGAHPAQHIIELSDDVNLEDHIPSSKSSNKNCISSNLHKCESPESSDRLFAQSFESISKAEKKKPETTHKNEAIEDLLVRIYGDLSNIKLITIASEFSRAIEAIKFLSSPPHNIIVSLGHSQTDYERGCLAVENGARMITHLFNAMPAFHHRNPSLPGLLCADLPSDIYYGIIADGIHTHPCALRIAYALGPKTLVLVTDALAPMNLRNGEYKLGKQTIIVQDNRATVKGTNTLCGCISSLPYCLKFFTNAIPCSIAYTLAAATAHPAKCMKVENEIGTLDFQTTADLVIIDDDFNVKQTYVAGELAYDAENPIDYDSQYADVLEGIYDFA